MNKKLILFSIIVLIAVGLSACAASASPTASSNAPTRSITVNGTGTVSLTPDMAIVQIGVQTQGADAQVAVEENNTKAGLIMTAMTDLGIEQGDIKTSDFSVYPNTRYDDNGNITDVTYMVNNTVQVTVRQLDQLGDVLGAAVKAGANSIGGIQYDLSDKESAYAQAMDLAMANARQRADVLAGAGEVQITAVQTISTNIGGTGITARNSVSAFSAADMAANVPVSSGEMEITVDVTVVYGIK